MFPPQVMYTSTQVTFPTPTSLETITAENNYQFKLNCDNEPGDFSDEPSKHLTTCYFNGSNYMNYNSEAPVYFKPNYPANYYVKPLGVTSDQSTYDPDKFFTPYIHTVQGSGHVSRLKFRTRERLFKFGNRVIQSNLTESDIVNETKIDHEGRLREQINKTKQTLWSEHTTYVNATVSIREKNFKLDDSTI